MAGDAALRDGLATLSQRADRDLTALLRRVTTAAEARVALDDLLPSLVEQYGLAAASLAAEWYEQARQKAGVRGAFAPVVPEVGDMGARSLVGWAASTATSVDTLGPLISGGLVKRLTVAAARTVGQSAIADPAARGWQRVNHGPCKSGFCDTLAGRGAVYTEASVDFAAHDHCRCTAVPAWKGREIPVRPFTPSERTSTDADRERVRAWIASH